MEVRSVKEPRGRVDWEDAIEGSAEGTLDNEDVNEAIVVDDLELAMEGDFGVGEPLRGESMLSLLRLGVVGRGGEASVTILIPLLVLVLAGMKRVVCLLAAGTAIRWG